MNLLEVRWEPGAEKVYVQSQTSDVFHEITRPWTINPHCSCQAGKLLIPCTHVNAWLELRLQNAQEAQMSNAENTEATPQMAVTTIVPASSLPRGVTQAQVAEGRKTALAAMAEGWGHALQLSRGMLASGLLPEAIKTPEAGALIIQMAVELNIPTNMAFSYIRPVKGQPFLMARMCGALIQRSGKGYIRAIERSPLAAEIEFVRYGDRPGWPARSTTVRFTMQDAIKAGYVAQNKANYENKPANMLWARALTTGAWMVFSDVMGGMDLVEDETGATFGEDDSSTSVMTIVEGEVRDVTEPETARKPAQVAAPPPATNDELMEAVRKMVAENKWAIADVYPIVGGNTRAHVLRWLREPGRSLNPVDDLETAIGIAKMPPETAGEAGASKDGDLDESLGDEDSAQPAPTGEAVAMAMSLGDDDSELA